MSNTAITDLLPVNSNIHGTPWEDFVNNTIGYFLELLEEEVDAINDGCFIESANGKYLDLHGKDLGLPRKAGEGDEDYRKRLLIEPLDKFNLNHLYTVYDVQLLSYNQDKNDLMLLSDNHHLANEYFIDVSNELWNIITNKFITGGVLHRWQQL